MRLLNKDTLEFEWFTTIPPPYIILSHRWLGRETSLQEFDHERIKDESCWSEGTKKVIRFCNVVKPYGTKFVWVDTCCIDKTSSTELQEAINSMFQWYQRASLCIVFLDDVSDSKGQSSIEEKLKQSVWFTRGWTLQELIAPKNLIFVDQRWQVIGKRESFAETIQKITHIPTQCLGKPNVVHSLSIAERMKWLSTRQTTREEDLAYCVLGIFDVNMPMLYGEGKKAFFRLQKELLHASDDESIFLWTKSEKLDKISGDWYAPSTILAPAPECFSYLLGREVLLDDWFDRGPSRLTAKGVEIETWSNRGSQFDEEIVVLLNVKVDGQRACLNLANESYKKDLGRVRKNKWTRINHDKLLTTDPGSRLPPTAQEQYERHVAIVQYERQEKHFQNTGNFSRPTLLPTGVLRAEAELRRGRINYALYYGAECIRFKVFVG